MPKSSNARAQALFIIFIVLGGHFVEARRATEITARRLAGSFDNTNRSEQGRSNATFRQTHSRRGAWDVPCQDPAKHRGKCPYWQHLCPSEINSQPDEFDEFMEEWCPETCGVCWHEDTDRPTVREHMVLAGTGCCRWDNYRSVHHGMKTEHQCRDACSDDPECLGVDMARAENGLFECHAYHGRGGNFRVECGESDEDQKCHIKSLHFEYRGCYANEGEDHIEGEERTRGSSITACASEARALGKQHFGMEWPENYATPGHARCLLLDRLPTMVQVSDADCEEEMLNHQRLGAAYRMAVYSVMAPTAAPVSAPTLEWQTVFQEVQESNNGVEYDNSDERTLNYHYNRTADGDYWVRLEWGSSKWIQFHVPMGSDIFDQSGEKKDIDIDSITTSGGFSPKFGTTGHFCHACVKNGDVKWGDTCWAVLPWGDNHRACGCNSAAWKGHGIYYGGNKAASQCSGHGGGFAGPKDQFEQKGNLSSIGLHFMISTRANQGSVVRAGVTQVIIPEDISKMQECCNKHGYRWSKDYYHLNGQEFVVSRVHSRSVVQVWDPECDSRKYSSYKDCLAFLPLECVEVIEADKNSILDPDAGPDDEEEGSEEVKCVSTMISRRRHRQGADMCACRRRSGTSGLSVGWYCNERQNRIVYNDLEDDLEHCKKLESQENESLTQCSLACCCKDSKCSYEGLRRGDVVSHVDAGGKQFCCKLKQQSFMGGCPFWQGYSSQKTMDHCVVATTANTSACSDRIESWLRDPSWYKLLEDWEFQKHAYKKYIPCMTPVNVHAKTVLLGAKNSLARVAAANPLRHFILLQPECAGLSPGKLLRAARASHRKLCPFPMPTTAYRPHLAPEGTCSYDPLDKTIQLQENRMCAEGHRCACPVFSPLSKGLESAYHAYATYSVVNSLAKGAHSAATAASGMTGMIATANLPAALTTAGTGLASLGVMVSGAFLTYAWPLTVGLGVVGLFAFGASYVWKWARHTCERNVGCYPMDCVEEPQGCRIRAPEDLTDERNPFWFLPPPTYKCAYKRGSCRLTQCSQKNFWNQTVGIRATTSWWKKGEDKTQVYNCQPMVSSDMTASQRVQLEEMTRDLKKEYDTKYRIMQRMRQRLEEICPWSRPTRDGVMRCANEVSCRALLMDQHCCLPHGGILQCPENFPLMCNNGYCSDDELLCQEPNPDSPRPTVFGRGGIKACPHAEACPWLLPSPAVGSYQCKDGSFMGEGWLFGWPCQEPEQKGVLRCPFEKPIMCAGKACGGDYCCAKDGKGCKRLGGVRECPALNFSLA